MSTPDTGPSSGRPRKIEEDGWQDIPADALGQKLATATAWYDIRKGDDGQIGWLHWVAVRRDAQGLGLSKPLITHALQKFEAVPDDELIRSENGG